MENEQRHYELRSGSRSRSRTPLVQGRILIEPEALEHHYDLRSQSRERSCTPGEVTSNRRSSSRILPGSSNKTNDQSSEIIVEKKKEICSTKGSTLDGENKRLESSSVSIKKGERRSERQKAKRQIFANGQTDNKEDSSGHKREKIHKGIPSCKTLTSDYSSEETDQDDSSNRPRSAHEIYKQAGDWWNVFPKTDYTYSERSKCRYEIAPGILAMPNMSRRSIHSNTEDFSRFSHDQSGSDVCDATNIAKEKGMKVENCTLSDEFHGSHMLNSDGKSKVQYTKRHVEQYHCHREVIYAEPKSTTNSQSRQLLRSDLPLKRIDSRKCDITSSLDSDAELDEVVSNNYNRRSKITQQFMDFTSVIVLWFSKLLEFLKLKTVKRREYCATYEYQRYESKWFRMWERIDHSLQYIYLFMVKVFFFDSWLLSRVSDTRKWVHQRRPRAFWIALLPLLLLTGTYVVQKQSFICLDSLHSIPYDVTETSYRIFNDIISLTSFQTDLFMEYIKTLKDLPVYFLPGVNVSLPEMP